MIALRDSIAMREAITHSLPSPLGRIIEQRITTLAEYVEIELGELVHFIVVEPGDQLAELEAELGFSPLVNLVDGSHFGDPAFAPPFEWLQDHGGWFELVYILSDDGFGKVVFIPDDPGIEFDLHMLCLEYAHRAHR
jgi:hypothetical protein